MEQIIFTEHARMRLDARRIPATAVEMALLFGRERRLNGDSFFAIGRREVERFTESGLDLRRFEGVHVVCAEDDVVSRGACSTNGTMRVCISVSCSSVLTRDC